MTARADRLVTKSLLDGPATRTQLQHRTGLRGRRLDRSLDRLSLDGRAGWATDRWGTRHYRAR